MTAITRFFNKYLFQPLEALAVMTVYGIFRMLPVDWASALGGFITRHLGPRLTLTKRAEKNLKRVFPDMDDGQRKKIILGMWDHLGRAAGEFPHLDRLGIYSDHGRIDVAGKEHIRKVIAGDKAVIYFTGHVGNWEICPLVCTALGTPVARVFREANNPLVNYLYHLGRRNMPGDLIAKGAPGARQLLKAIKQGKHVGMLVDQKMNDGIAVPFMGHDAMTAPALAEMARRYDCQIIPVRSERINGTHFRITVSPPLKITKTDDRKQDILRIMTDVNAILESWIRDKPEQWLWLHNRWPD